MKIAAVRYTRRWNMGNYEHTELAIETVPDENQTAEDLLAATREFVEQQRPGANGAPVSNGNGKSTAPPLAGKQAEPKKEAPPVETAEPATKKRGRGRPSKALQDAKAAVDAAMKAETLEDFLDRFNEAREKADAFTADEWESCVKSLAVVYRELNSAEADPDVVTQLIQAFKAERTALDEKRAAESN